MGAVLGLRKHTRRLAGTPTQSAPRHGADAFGDELDEHGSRVPRLKSQRKRGPANTEADWATFASVSRPAPARVRIPMAMDPTCVEGEREEVRYVPLLLYYFAVTASPPFPSFSPV